MVVHLFLNNNKDLDFLPINSIKNGGVTVLSKQIKKQNFMQNLSKEIPVLISQQDDFQAQIKAVLVNGESQ